MILPRPRSYIDWEVPKDKNGHDIGVCSDTETFNYYIGWLADYLFYTDIPLPENQLTTLKVFERDKGIESAVFWTSDDLGYSLWDVEGIEDSFVDGVSYKEFHDHELKMWNELDEDEKEMYENPSEEFFISEEEYNRIGKEKIESQKVPKHIQHADIPYRSIFAKLIKSVPEKEERIKHLEYFYYNFNECASK